MVWLGCIHIKMKTQYQKWHVNSGFWGYTTQDAPYVMHCAIWYHLYNLKHLKTPMEDGYF